MGHSAEPGQRRPPSRRTGAAGVVYGVLAVATVVAAESTRRETYAKVITASAVAMALYWLAHAYAQHLGERFERPKELSARHFLGHLVHEVGILAGAALPVFVLAISWAAGAGLETGVSATLWFAGVELVGLEVATGVRRRLPRRDMAIETAIGIGLGVGILGIRILLH